MQVFAVHGPGEPVKEIEVPTPELAGKEVLVRITHSGVCHSDVHCQEGHFDLGSAGKLPLAASGVEWPAVFGHEIVGTVVAAGPEASVQPGDTQYIVFPWIGCGNCQACREDRENYCPRGRNLSVGLRGGFAREVWVPDERYLIGLGDLDPAWGATLACSGVTSYSAVNKVLPRGEEDVVAVIGAGGVGLMAVAMLKALGHRKIAVVDVSDENLEIAKKLGATITFNSKVDNPGAALLEATGELNWWRVRELVLAAEASAKGDASGETRIREAVALLREAHRRGSAEVTLRRADPLRPVAVGSCD